MLMYPDFQNKNLPLPPLDWNFKTKLTQKAVHSLGTSFSSLWKIVIFTHNSSHKSRLQVKTNHSIFNMKTAMKIAGKIAIQRLHTQFGPILGGLVYIF